MLKSLITLTFISLLLLIQGCSSDNENTQELNEMVVTNEFILTQTDNTQYTVHKVKDGFKIKEAKGKAILFNVFATWCPPCQGEAMHLSSLQDKFKEDLLIIGVTVEEGIENEKLEAFKKEFRAKFPIVNSAENRRFITALADDLGVGRNFGIPLMALYKDGKLINYYQGATEEEFLESDIKKAVEK